MENEKLQQLESGIPGHSGMIGNNPISLCVRLLFPRVSESGQGGVCMLAYGLNKPVNKVAASANDA